MTTQDFFLFLEDVVSFEMCCFFSSWDILAFRLEGLLECHLH